MIAWLLAASVLAALWKRVDYFHAFSQGAEDGFRNAVRLVPTLAVTMIALRVFESSGILDALNGLLTPLARLMGLPAGVMPLLLLRPISGSASLAALNNILTAYGPDSRAGLVASAMMGSGETVLYTCAVYLSAAGITRSRYIIPAALAGWVAGCVVAGLFFASAA